MSVYFSASVITGILLIQCLIGGSRLLFSLPAYGILAIASAFTVFGRREKAGSPSLDCLAVSAVFFSYILVRAALSPTPYLWWPDFFMVLACLAVFLITAYWITTPRQQGAVIVTLFILAIVQVFIGLRQFTYGDDWMPFDFLQRPSSGRRASGMFMSSIHLAGYLEAVAPFALSFSIWSAWKGWARILAGYCAGMCFLGIAITGSRGGYLSVLFSIVAFTALSLYAARKTRPQKFGRTAAVACTLLAVGTAAALTLMSKNETLQKRLAMIPQQLEKNKLDVRIYNWQAALDQFGVSPVLGTGAGTHLYYGRLFRRAPLQSDPIHAHSDYLELLAEYGVVGAIGMLAFLGVHLRRGAWAVRDVLNLHLAKSGPHVRLRDNRFALILGGLSAIAAYLVHSITDFNLHIPGNALVLAFVFGVLATLGATTPEAGNSAPFRWALPLLGFVTIAFGLPKLPGEYWCEKARVALRNGDHLSAIALAHKALAHTHLNPDLYFYLGEAHRGAARAGAQGIDRTNHLTSAVEAFQKGLGVFPQDEHMLVRLGDALDRLGRFKEAREIYQKALALDPNLGVLHAYYARHLALVGREEEAESAIKRARELSDQNLAPILEGTFFAVPAAGP